MIQVAVSYSFKSFLYWYQSGVTSSGSYFQFTFDPTNRTGFFKLDISVDLNGHTESALSDHIEIEVVKHHDQNCTLCRLYFRKRKPDAAKANTPSKRRTSSSTTTSSASLSPNEAANSNLNGESLLAGFDDWDSESDLNVSLPVENLSFEFENPVIALTAVAGPSFDCCPPAHSSVAGDSVQNLFSLTSSVPSVVYDSGIPSTPDMDNGQVYDQFDDLLRHLDFNTSVRNVANQRHVPTEVLNYVPSEVLDPVIADIRRDNGANYFEDFHFDSSDGIQFDGERPVKRLRPEYAETSEDKGYKFDYIFIFALLGIFYHFIRSFFFLD